LPICGSFTDQASCTLEAGVKIYSLRVDSVHSEAYKVLGGINRAGRGEEAGEDPLEFEMNYYIVSFRAILLFGVRCKLLALCGVLPYCSN
jgi:hypothetical protein